MNVANPDLILHLALNEISQDQVIDASGNGNDGTLGGHPQLTVDDTFGFCLRFDGSADYVIVNPLAGIPLEALTTSFWIRSYETTQVGTPLSYANLESSNAFSLLDHRDLDVYLGASYERSTGVSASDGNWHHIAVTWQSSDGQIRMYKDGIEAHTGTIGAGASIQPGGSLVLGQEQDAVGGSFDPTQAFRGDLAHVRLYRRVLTATEIGHAMQNDLSHSASLSTGRSPNETFADTYPLSFRLSDEQEQSAIYIANHHEGHDLYVEISITSPKVIELAGLPGEEASPANHHFELRFRPGTLSQSSLSQLAVESSGWRFQHMLEPDGIVSIFLASARDRTWLPGTSLTIPLNYVSAASQGGSRQTQVELRYQQLRYRDEASFLSGYRLTHLQVIDLRGKVNIPLHVGFVGASTVVNNGQSNALTVQIANISQLETLTFDTVASEMPSRFVISTDAQPPHQRRDWALATESQIQGIILSIDNPNWQIDKEIAGETTEWILTPKQKTTLAAGESLQIELSDIISTLPSGHAHLYVRYEHIPGYRDGIFVLTVEKGPIFYKDIEDDDQFVTTYVGVGTNDPRSKLTVQDGGLTVQSEIDGHQKGWSGEWQGDGATLRAQDWGDATGQGGGAQPLRLEGSTIALNSETQGSVGIGTKTPRSDAKLDVAGKAVAQSFEGDGIVPKGAIVMWSGTSVPANWALCNGQMVNGYQTPDLRGRFIVGYADNDGSYNQPGNRSERGSNNGQTGGAPSVVLNANQMPSHNHTANASAGGGHQHWMEGENADGLAQRQRTIPGQTTVDMNFGGGWNADPNDVRWRGHVNTDTTGYHGHAVSVGSAGGNQAHENRPPYYVLAFIMKV